MKLTEVIGDQRGEHSFLFKLIRTRLEKGETIYVDADIRDQRTLGFKKVCGTMTQPQQIYIADPALQPTNDGRTWIALMIDVDDKCAKKTNARVYSGKTLQFIDEDIFDRRYTLKKVGENTTLVER